MIAQISIFAENRKGAMRKLTDVLGNAGIDIIALVTNDSAEFGIVRMIVSDPALAEKRLAQSGYMVHKDLVMAVDLEDRPGGLNRLLASIDESNTNIDYLYISYDRALSVPIAVIHSGDLEELEQCLKNQGYHVRSTGNFI
ncbi:amino acid-binding protein [Bilifractor porci]|uniref:Amino acid-binding protein n=1 Tax=Bilifractor porci TaxID=2606636 RepID=A0A7X2TNV6_9FIRM|nr:amino acid-binding protein [Bilifractor porci]MST81323.1 amino acid-binding protein [Bilifractor porci]